MADREKVIDILGACGTDDCDNCPHRNEADLLDQLDCVRAEKFNISMKLNSSLEALKVMKTLEEDPS